MSRECRKCKELIPNGIVVDGAYKTLCNRKFCLKCSPYNKHNTKPDDPMRPSKRKGCYVEWTPEEKKKLALSCRKRGLLRKRKLIALSGGACVRCGYKYNGCERALSFHHKFPKDKKYGLTVNNLWSKSWEDILIEFSKCEMLCVRFWKPALILPTVQML